MRPDEQRKYDQYTKDMSKSKRLNMPYWWRALAPTKGPRFWRSVEALRKEAGVSRRDVDGITLIINKLKGFSMSGMKDITDALAKQYNGIDLDEGKPKPKAEPRSWDNGGGWSDAEQTSFDDFEPVRSKPVGTGMSFRDGTKIWPSEKFDLRTTASRVMNPRRPPVMMAIYSDDELEWMFSTPCKRGWEFKDWLEVIGLPTDLKEGYDGAMYQYAARAFLNRKKEAHNR